MKKTILFPFLCCAAFALNGQNTAVDDFVHLAAVRNANVSISVVEVQTGKMVAQHRAESLVTPASVLKTVTTATALELLGADFRFLTTLETDNLPDENGVLDGNLVIVGGGDPTLGSAHFPADNFLNSWVAAVKRAGIKTVRGKILFDEKRFDEHDAINPTWLAEDIGNYYAAGVYGISYIDNLYVLTFKTGAAGTQPQIIGTKPPIADLHFDNFLKTAGTGDNAYIHGSPKSYRRSLYGTLPPNQNTFSIKGDLPYPADVLRTDFLEKLKENGITIEGGNPNSANLTDKIVLQRHLSPLLSEIVKVTNTQSNNHFAEHILRQLALTKYDVANSERAVEVVKNFWQSKGLPVKQLAMRDGSGLSPKNAVSAEFLTKMLCLMHSKTAFRNSLPLAGQAGTVKNFLNKTALEGRVRVKSGTIAQVRAYAGYIDAEDGKTYAFAVIVNHFGGTSRQAAAEIEKLLLNLNTNLK